MQPTLDLFDTVAHCPSPAALLAVFEHWAAAAPGRGGPMRAESVSVYRDIWTSLLKWSVPKNIDVIQITPAELEAYLQSRGGADELDERYAWRALRLVERVLQYHARASDTEPNSAVAALLARRPDLKYANAGDRAALPDFLDAGDARALVAALSAPGSRANGASHGNWQDLRNRVAVALHLGAGLTPADVRALRLESVHGLESGTRKVRVPANGNIAERESPVAPWAWRLLTSWISLRAQLAIAGEWLLPATKSGRQWGKTAHHEAVASVLDSVGLDGAGGAYRLRHTFALRQIKRGRSLGQVAAWLGIDETAAARYRRVLPGPVEVV